MLLKIRRFLLVLIVTVLFFKLSISYGAQNITKVSVKQGLRNITGKKRQYIPGFMPMARWRFPAIVVCQGCTDECNVHKDCPPGKFCDVHTCRDCLHEHAACHFIGTCCEGFVCQYGHCTKGVKQGEPGTYCDKTSDCLGKESCCVREISVNTHTSVCKPMLNEFESCGPINLFHHIYNGGRVEPDCGPCKDGFQCKNVGTKGLHFVCLKENEE